VVQGLLATSCIRTTGILLRGHGQCQKRKHSRCPLVAEIFSCSVTAFSSSWVQDRHSLLYIWTPNNGNAAAKYDRANELAAKADAAYRGYCSARSVQIRALSRYGHRLRCRSTYAFDKKCEDTTIAPDDAAAEIAVSDELLINDTCMSGKGKPYPIPKMAEKIIGTAVAILSAIITSSICRTMSYLSNAPAGTRLAEI
jgi:hypothetical protein